MIIWGAHGLTGAQYNLSSDSWTPTSTINAPAARFGATAIWTGSTMVIWGGLGSDYKNDGGQYNPTTDSWTPTAGSSFRSYAPLDSPC